MPDLRDRLEGSPVDVGHQIAEAVDPEDDAADRRVVDLRERNIELVIVGRRTPERRQLDALRQPAAAGAKRSRPSKVRLTVGRA